MESMREVLVYDSGTGSWYGQATTAEEAFPSGRYNFCAVVASAPDNSSHNIYVYAGEAPSANPDAYSDMWILSLPSFHWIYVDVQSQPQKALGCTTAAERYMITYGGVKAGYGEDGDTDDCNQENYGLRLFDLSGLAWTSRYEGHSEEQRFNVTGLVYGIIGGDGQSGATQTAPSVGFETASPASLFQRSSPTITSSTISPSSTGITTSSKNSTNTRVIAGGVIGSVVGMSIIIIGFLCLMKRTKTRAPYASASAAEFAQHELEGQSGGPGELAGDNQEPEHNAYELYGELIRAPQEMHAGHASPLLPMPRPRIDR